MVPKITDAHHDAMTANGYFILEDVFSQDEMEGVAARLEEFEARMNQDLAKAGGSAGISRANEITFTDHIAERDEVIADFCRRPEFVAITTEFLGPNVDLYWNQTVFKHPEGDKVFPWHQDDAYTAVNPSPYLTLWLAINDATPENGCISVLPGSHRDGLRPHEPSAIGLVGYSNEAADQGVPAPVRAGSIVCFWSLTLHKSGPNRSKGIRKAYVIQYATSGLRRVVGDELIEGLMPVVRDGQSVLRDPAAV